MKFETHLFVLFILLSCNFSLHGKNNEPDNFIPEAFEKNLASLGGGPSAMVNGCVNAITGAYIEYSTDMVVPGPEPILMQKSYTSYSGWRLIGHEYIDCQRDTFDRRVVTHLKDGMGTCYDSINIEAFGLAKRNFIYGLTNCGQGKICGQTNPNNQKIYFENLRKAVLIDGAGVRKIYENDLQDKETYNLKSIHKPNGNLSIVNNSLKKNPFIYGAASIFNFNADRQGLNQISYDIKDFQIDPRIIATVNDGRECHYAYQKAAKETYQIGKVIRPNGPLQTFEYDSHSRMKANILPEGRRQNIYYYNQGANPIPGLPHLNINIDSFLDPAYSRVLALASPVGTDATPLCTHRFIYNVVLGDYNKTYYYNNNAFKYHVPIKSGSTTVIDAHGKATHYHYDGQLRLTGIEQYLNGRIFRKNHYLWGHADQEEVKGNLLFTVLSDGDGSVYRCHTYNYDNRGNVISEHLGGVLTGKNLNPVQRNIHGVPVFDGADVYTKTYVYSDDGLNLLLQENDGRKQIQYLYYNGTNLLLAKTLSHNGQMKYREFYAYDRNGSPIIIVKDDGSSWDGSNLEGVSERHIVRTQYRQTTPIGLPQIIEEAYLDLTTNQEVSLKKTENVHDLYGNLIQQNHYDSNGSFIYALFWEYNSHHKVIKEINAAGHQSHYAYDENDNLIFEQHPGNVYHTRHYYDYSNRLIRSEDIHPNTTLYTHYSYNFLSQCISKTDWYGHQTTFEYDDCGRLRKINHPAVQDEKGNFYNPSEHMDYDLADYPVSKMDARGFSTTMSVNIRGQPYFIQYTDGSSEKKEYNLDGLLEKSVSLNGTTTQNYYDYLGRPCKVEIRTSTGQVTETHCHYNFFHKLLELDPSGIPTHYQYDQAGRLISVINADAKTTFEYDTCQRIHKTLEYFGPGEADYVAKIQEYDVLSQVIEERHEDANGQILNKAQYTYNERGEKTQSFSFHLDTPSITQTTYNPYGEVDSIIDPQGHITLYKYYYGHLNKYGQHVLAKETIDAMGNTLYQEHDAQQRLRYEIRKNAMGVEIQKREFFYDATGNLVKQLEYVLTPNQEDRLVVTAFAYDFSNNLTDCIEAVGTPEQKHTQHLYNQFREKTQIIKPDGVRIDHTYDGLGRLVAFKSSDGSFHYQYTYDTNSNVIQVDDKKNNRTTHRKFDKNNRQTQETLANGISIGYAYDGLGRTTQLTLPDKTSIDYFYNSLHLSKIKRGNYTHSYLKYNLSGLLERSQMIGNAGEIEYKIDNCHRLIAVSSNHFKDEIPSDGFDACGNLLKKTTTDTIGLIDGKFAYDQLHQLKEESGITDHTFVHDSLYNLIQKDHAHHQINNLNQLLHDGNESCVYDRNGNLVQKGALTLSYDALDRLTTVKGSDVNVTYSYDELNRRLTSIHRHKNNEKQIRYIYQGLNEIGTCNESNVINQLRVLGLGKGAEIGASVLVEFDGVTYAPVHDISGNVCTLVKADNGKVHECYRYSAYGQEQIYDRSKTAKFTSINPWRFSSKRTDDETHFVYFGRRYYNPETTRWVTADPLGYEAGPNLYAYVFNNPLSSFDLYGLERCFNDDLYSHTRERDERIQEGRETKDFLNKNETNHSERSLPTVSYYDYEKKFIHYSKSQLAKYEGTESKSNFLCFAGGINNTAKNYKEVGKYLRSLGWEYEIYLQINETHNILNDLIECEMGRCNVATNPVKVIHEAWNDIFKKSANAKILQICFSQGAINVTNALLSYDTELRQHISVVAIAPGGYIYEKTCDSVSHYRASCLRDPIPYSDIMGARRNNHNTQTLKSHKNADFFDHKFMSPTYTATIKYHIDLFNL